MQKLSSEIVKRILCAGLTQSELASFLLVCRLQDSTGLVRGLSYKYTSGLLNTCNQTFYNAKEGLEEKGFIKTEKRHFLDIDVRILNNNFTGKDFSKGYINLQMQLFDDENFYKLSANEMAMALDLLRMRFNQDTDRQGIKAKDFIQCYKDIFKVTERSIRNYIHNLRKYFNINIFNHKYYIALKKKWGKDTQPGHAGEEDKYREHIAEVACKRAKVKNRTKDVISDLITLIRQYRKQARETYKDIAALVIDAVNESIIRGNALTPKYKWDYNISVAYVHKILQLNWN